MKAIRIASLLAGITALACIGACNTHRTSSGDPAMAHVDLNLDVSSHDIIAGEVVTLTARTQDTYGRDSDIKWESTSGKITTEQKGRIARVKFDQPGTYSVSAILTVDGREAKRETAEIRVKPLP